MFERTIILFMFLILFLPGRNKVNGNLIGHTGIADAPGYIDLDVYDSGQCVLTYGGPMSSEEFVKNYTIKGDSLIVECEDCLLELRGQDIIIEDDTLVVVQTLTNH